MHKCVYAWIEQGTKKVYARTYARGGNSRSARVRGEGVEGLRG